MRRNLSRIGIVIACVVALMMAAAQAGEGAEYFVIRVVDEQSRRGVPLIELRTVNSVRYYTDSNGIVAFHEPGLMGQEVFLHVSGHGYEFAEEVFGMRGRRLRPEAGGEATLQVRRVNIAERLYRVTGAGIYRDSALAGMETPIRWPVENAKVGGQDSVQAVVYRGRIYWFWGDTSHIGRALGHFRTAGATSELPEQGGLDPAAGVDLEYFVDETGFSRPMVPLEGEGMYWIDGLMVLEDDAGRERLVARYARMKSLGEALGRGLIAFNDEREEFEMLAELPLDGQLQPAGHAVRVKDEGRDYFYFAVPYPHVRVEATWEKVQDPSAYEAFTCLAPDSRYEKDAPALDRDERGRLVWGWKRGTAPVSPQQLRELIDGGHITAEEAWHDLRDVESGRPVQAHSASVYWNEHRGRWIMITCEIWGEPSLLGEVWYAEADAPQGPWRLARKIVTHEQYSFYNVKQHPFFGQEDGRFIYFEGTYTQMFSGNQDPTPWYDYNQIMYRLDLDDPRLGVEELVAGGLSATDDTIVPSHSSRR